MPSPLDSGWRQEGCWLCTGRTSIHFLRGGNCAHMFSRLILFPIIQEGAYSLVQTFQPLLPKSACFWQFKSSVSHLLTNEFLTLVIDRGGEKCVIESFVFHQAVGHGWGHWLHNDLSMTGRTWQEKHFHWWFLTRLRICNNTIIYILGMLVGLKQVRPPASWGRTSTLGQAGTWITAVGPAPS